MARRFLSMGTDFCKVLYGSVGWSESKIFIYLSIFSEDHLKRLGQDVSRLSMSKDSLGWDLVALEHAVQTAREGPSDSDDEEPDSERPALLQ